MNSLLILIPLSILLLVGAGAVLFWAVDHGQFDDMETPGLLPMLDGDPAPRDAEPVAASGGDAADSTRPSR